MQFSIRTIVIATTGAAILLALARAAFDIFLIVFITANAALLFGPVAILLTTIVFADQRGTYLEISSNPFYSLLKRLWLVSVASVIVVWSMLIAGAFL